MNQPYMVVLSSTSPECSHMPANKTSLKMVWNHDLG